MQVKSSVRFSEFIATLEYVIRVTTGLLEPPEYAA